MDKEKCFISYAWESEEIKDWVEELATKLREKDGVYIILDKWHLLPGQDLAYFMENSINESKHVLLICTPTYADKANHRRGGVGYENTIITGELLTSKNLTTHKFIPLLKIGNEKLSLPNYLKTKRYIDFREQNEFNKSYQELLETLYPYLKKIPSLGKPPIKYATDTQSMEDNLDKSKIKEIRSEYTPEKIYKIIVSILDAEFQKSIDTPPFGSLKATFRGMNTTFGVINSDFNGKKLDIATNPEDYQITFDGFESLIKLYNLLNDEMQIEFRSLLLRNFLGVKKYANLSYFICYFLIQTDNFKFVIKKAFDTIDNGSLLGIKNMVSFLTKLLRIKYTIFKEEDLNNLEEFIKYTGQFLNIKDLDNKSLKVLTLVKAKLIENELNNL